MYAIGTTPITASFVAAVNFRCLSYSCQRVSVCVCGKITTLPPLSTVTTTVLCERVPFKTGYNTALKQHFRCCLLVLCMRSRPFCCQNAIPTIAESEIQHHLSTRLTAGVCVYDENHLTSSAASPCSAKPFTFNLVSTNTNSAYVKLWRIFIWKWAGLHMLSGRIMYIFCTRNWPGSDVVESV